MAVDWEAVRIFHTAAETGSFTSAARALGLSQSAISRRIQALEEQVNTALFHRHARGLVLTEPGEVLFRTTREVVSKLAMAEALLADGRARPRGPLYVTSTFAFSSWWLAARLHRFCDTYPDIQVTLLIEDRQLDLNMRQADVAIRMTPSTQPDLVQRPLFNVTLRLVASPAYLERHGTPEDVDALARHRLLGFPPGVGLPFPDANALIDLMAERDDGTEGQRVYASNLFAIYRAAESGLGIAALPTFLITQGLQPIMPDLDLGELNGFFVYPEEMRRSKRIAVFREFLLAELGAEPWFRAPKSL